MKIRRAILSEAPTIADVATRAFKQDPSYGHFYPWRDHYPEDFYRHLLHKYRRIILTPGCRIMVAELDEDDLAEKKTSGSDPTGEKATEDTLGKIVGFATFMRSGGTQEDQDRWNPDSISKKLQRCVLALQNGVGSTLSPNRAVWQKAIDTFWDEEVAIHDSTPRGENGKIDVMTLAVLPGYQRRGVGERLVEYSGLKAMIEGIPIFCDASARALPLYVSKGSKVIGVVVLEETTYKKWFGRMPIKRDRLETPVIRWDAENLTDEQADELQSRIKAKL